MTTRRTHDPRRIDLEIRRAVEPIQGLVRAGGRSAPFSGWLGLAGALGRLVGSDADRHVTTSIDQRHDPPDQQHSRKIPNDSANPGG